MSRVFPYPDSCLRLILALLAEVDDDWDPQGLSQPQPVTPASWPPPRKFTEKELHNQAEVAWLLRSPW